MSGGPGSGPRRLLGVAAVAVCVLVTAPSGSASSIAGLQAANANIAQQSRSAVLDLYSLDAQVASAQAQLERIRAEERALGEQRASLATELRYARADTRLSQQRIAMRVRYLYDHGTTSTLDVFFGASSLSQAVTELDDFDRVMSVNDDVLTELQASELRLTRLTHRLTSRQLSLDAAARQAAAVTAALEQSQAQRSAYIGQLSSQQSANVAAIDRLEEQAQAAEQRAQALPAPITSPMALAAAIVPANAAGARTLTVSATGYSLPGHTATGLPVGWGIVAVDPSVIPLGTHMTIPGYGEAVAADTGSAVIGDTIDLWFPSTAQAEAWGRRSVTIDLH